MIEFEVNGKQYRADKLDAIRQFHVSRKIAPLIPSLIPVFVKISKDGGMGEDMEGLQLILQPFADGLAAMPDESADYVLSNCLSVVRRQSIGTWAFVWNAQAKTLMFDDMDMGDIIFLLVRVIQDSLGNFINGLLTGGPQTQA